MQTRRVGGDSDIGSHCQGKAQTHGRSVDPRNHRLVRVEPQGEKKPAYPALLIESSLLVRQPGLGRCIIATTQVEPRAERIAVAGQRDNAHVVIDMRLAHRPHDGPPEWRRERVLPLWAVEPQHPDMADSRRLQVRHQLRLPRCRGGPAIAPATGKQRGRRARSAGSGRRRSREHHLQQEVADGVRRIEGPRKCRSGASRTVWILRSGARVLARPNRHHDGGDAAAFARCRGPSSRRDPLRVANDSPPHPRAGRKTRRQRSPRSAHQGRG